ncbi:coumarin 8-geranyltransferase 1, chloroplastic-like [Macadamia integrifolia]|uniref:coumarin 8-geranyltransferase 1, chloroplastic-like n=1 Tax=Macadamia integrifolia TaxID=60698 RepID=UPI001C4FEB58|nr:coumarin 8-geranyltransferase 1, chloroplastic-like [Macadamia integrifolia]
MLGVAASSSSLQAHPSHERGWLSREPKSLKASFVVPFQGQVNCEKNIKKKWHSTQRFQCCSQRSSALGNNEGNVEIQSSKQDRLENDYSSKQEDAYNGPLGKIYALYRFTRPYAAMGTGLSVASVSCLPIETIADFTPTFFVGVLKAIIPTVLAHIYSAGVNQVYDIEIDKANKKNLPIASEVFSIETAKTIVWIVTLLSLSMGVMSQSLALLCGILSCFMYGTIYSVDLPFLRWKRDPILAAAIIGFWKGIGSIIPYFIHAQNYILGRPIIITKSLIFASVVMSLHVFLLLVSVSNISPPCECFEPSFLPQTSSFAFPLLYNGFIVQPTTAKPNDHEEEDDPLEVDDIYIRAALVNWENTFVGYIIPGKAHRCQAVSEGLIAAWNLGFWLTFLSYTE